MVLVSFIEYPFTVCEKDIVTSNRREGKVIVTNMNIYWKNMVFKQKNSYFMFKGLSHEMYLAFEDMHGQL
jgi:hypothetical protein